MGVVSSLARRVFHGLLAVAMLLALSQSGRAEFFCFDMQRTMARCCCGTDERVDPPEPEPSVERAPCCERRVSEANAPPVRLDGSTPSVEKAKIALAPSSRPALRAMLTSRPASQRRIDTGPRAGPALALYARTSRYLI
jgi:hypothetical protein